MAVAGAHFGEQFRVVASRRFAGEIVPVAHLDRRGRVVVGYAPVLNEDAGHAVGRRGHDVGIVEADVSQVYVQFAVPVLRARLRTETEVPLPDGRRAVTCRPEHVSQGVLFGTYNHTRVSRRHVRPLAAKWVFARQ